MEKREVPLCLGETGLLVITGSLTGHFGNQPAQTSDTSSPHPDFVGNFLATTAEHSKQENEANGPDASDCNFGGIGLAQFRLFVLVDHVLAARAVFAYVFIWFL